MPSVWSYVPRITFRRFILLMGALLAFRFGPNILWPSFLRKGSATAPAAAKSSCMYFLGRELVVDDQGVVCLWDSPQWNRTTGCCAGAGSAVDECGVCSGSPFLCCPMYERCVACCQQRGTTFKFCLQNCRFSSKSVEGIKFKIMPS